MILDYWIPFIIGIIPQSSNYLQNTLHIFAENASAKRHNLKMLQSFEGNIFTIPAKEQFPKNIPRQKIIEVLNQNQSETRVLAGALDVELDVRVMLSVMTANFNLHDILVNGQLGTVKFIMYYQRNVSKVYKKFDDSKAGLKRMNKNGFRKQNLWVPVEKAEFDIKIKSLMLAWACSVHQVTVLQDRHNLW